MKARRPGSVAFALAMLLSAVGCGPRDLGAEGGASNPLVLVLAPSHGAEPEALTRLEAAIERESGLSVDIQVAASAQAAVTRAGTARLDAAILPLFDYLFCHQQYGATAGLQVLRGESATTYRGEILVGADSDITGPEGLDGKAVAFVDRYSTSGFLFPASLIAESGATPVPVFAGSHSAALDELRAGRVAAAAVWVGAAAGESTVRSLATTAPIANEPLFFRAGLDAALRDRLTAALLAVSEDSGGRELLASLADISGFKRADDAAYKDVHEAISRAGRRVEDLVPQGWRIRHENDRSLLGDFAL